MGCDSNGENAQYLSGDGSSVGSTKMFIINPGTQYIMSNWIIVQGKRFARLEVAPALGTANVSISWAPDSVTTPTRLYNVDLIESNTPPPYLGKYVVNESQLSQFGWSRVNQPIVYDLNNCLKRFNITTANKVQYFLSQCAAESAKGIYNKEIGSGIAYNNRADLCNGPTDGPRFKGVGYVQITGKCLYQAFANSLEDQNVMQGVDYVASRYPWSAAGFRWNMNKLNELCDTNSTVEQVTKRLMGNFNGLEGRKLYYEIAQNIFK